ncbi:unnamed protein product, partial [Didymodactylos carnosus]
MQTKLPDYMIPNRLMRVEKIPVTLNGKLDAKGLPDSAFSCDEKNYIAPRNELEVKLCQIWSDLLGIDKTGITDDFFRLGGDSIGSLQLIGRIRKDLDLSVSVKDLRFKQIDDKRYIQYYDSSSTTANIFPLNHLDIRNLGPSDNEHQLLNEILTEQWSQLVQSYAVRKSATEGLYWRNLVSNVLCFNDGLSKCNAVFDNRPTTTATDITLSTIQTCSLLRDCPHAYDAHINVLLLTALGYALKELTRNRINYVTLEGHGREDIDGDNMDISRTVGWFTTMHPVLLEIGDDLRRSIMNVKVHLMQVPNKGIGYGTIIGYKDQDLPRVSFNYLGQFEAAPSTKAGSSSNNRGWYLTNGVVGDEVGDDRADKAADGDVIAMNGLCMKGQIRFNIKSRLNSERTTQFANSFKSKLEDIIRECFATKPLSEMDYSDDFEHPFVVLNADSDNILFILPPGGGGAESYFNNIVPHLSPYKLIVFNNYYRNLKEQHMEKGFSFETLARLYIKYIKLIQLNGPYNFLGWSFGGVLSFEISRQLNNAGDEI